MSNKVIEGEKNLQNKNLKQTNKKGGSLKEEKRKNEKHFLPDGKSACRGSVLQEGRAADGTKCICSVGRFVHLM